MPHLIFVSHKCVSLSEDCESKGFLKGSLWIAQLYKHGTALWDSFLQGTWIWGSYIWYGVEAAYTPLKTFSDIKIEKQRDFSNYPYLNRKLKVCRISQLLMLPIKTELCPWANYPDSLNGNIFTIDNKDYYPPPMIVFKIKWNVRHLL